jgi:hypothetical protein
MSDPSVAVVDELHETPLPPPADEPPPADDDAPPPAAREERLRGLSLPARGDRFAVPFGFVGVGF